MPGLLLGELFPNFEAETTTGKIKFHDFLGDSWGILFSHPRDYTPVCTTELGRAATLSLEFSRRNVKMIALSIDSLEDHHGWIKDILAYNIEGCGGAFPFPIIADHHRELAVGLGMLDPEEKDEHDMPLTARCVFVIGPDKRLKLSLLYPATTGRNFDEILRVIDSLQLTAHSRVATPADWQPGDRVMVPPTMPEEEAAAMFPAGVYTKDLPSGRRYLRYTPQPQWRQSHTNSHSASDPNTQGEEVVKEKEGVKEKERKEKEEREKEEEEKDARPYDGGVLIISQDD